MIFQISGTAVWLLFFMLSFGFVSAEEGCYGAGFVATSVVFAVLITLCVVGAACYWFRRRPKTEHLILETDPEKGKAEYAFDNPGFKDATLVKLQEKSPTKNELEREEKKKRANWANISAHITKTEKKKAKDDCFPAEDEVKVICLKSRDFTGLGFNICGNMKEGIYIKDILHRGPASESGMLNTGDRIRSVTINFEHIVYEDALNILSFASPYEIKVEATGGKILFGSSSKSNHPSHPLYRSASSIQLQELNMSKKSLFIENSLDSNRSTFPISLSNTTTLERKNSKSPRSINQIQSDKYQNGTSNSDQLKNQLEQKILIVENETRMKIEPPKMKIETQKTDFKHQKFGIKVLPADIQTGRSSGETQNHKNLYIEKHIENTEFDEVDKKTEESSQSIERFNRNDNIYGSGLKRDENGIPQEIPSHMLNAAVAARRNRKSQEDIFFEEDTKILKKIKNKAPSPPTNKKSKDDDNMNFKEAILEIKRRVQVEDKISEKDNLLRSDGVKKFSSDSDDDTDNQSSVNTVKLNLSQIIIHQIENDEKQNRKTASTGDLTKIHRTRKSSTGTLERAKSLDITDSGISNLSQKIKGDEDFFDVNSEDDLFRKTMLDKEPNLSLILDGLNTFQRNRLKKSTEWGNLEDAILRSNQDHENMSPISEQNLPAENSNFKLEEKSAEFNAVVNKINEIKNESQESDEIEIKDSSEVIDTDRNEEILYDEQKPKNQLWPTETETSISIQPVNSTKVRTKSANKSSLVIENTQKINIQNEIWPKELEKHIIDQRRKEQNDNEGINLISTENEMSAQNKNSTNEETIRDNKTNVVTTLGGEVTTNQSSYKEELNPMSEVEFQKNKREESDTRIVNKDPIIDNNSNNMDKDMIISETPPDAISELDTINLLTEQLENNEINTVSIDSNTGLEQIQMNTIIVSNKIKTHKRQQIPIEESEILLPPEMDDSDLEKGMFELSNETSSKIPERAITKVNADLLVPGCSLSQIKHTYKKQESYLGFERNSETGELCTTMNNTDESKTLKDTSSNYPNENENFIFNEKYLNSQDGSYNAIPGDTNVSDDIKVSRHSFGSLERPKSDDAKSIESIKYSSNVSNVTVNNVNTENGTSSLHSLELSVNNNSSGDAMKESLCEHDLYTTALNNSLETEKEKNKISISTPDLIKNVSITEAINTLNGNMDEIMNFKEISKVNNAISIGSTENPEMGDPEVQKSSVEHMLAKHSSLTYITEIQVTPASSNTNISEIEIVPSTNIPSPHNLENQMSSYRKNYFESLDTKKEGKNQIDVENRIESSKNIDSEEKPHEAQKIVQEQLKKLPEMRFSTASYESPVEKVEKRQSQVELLKSNFERSPPKSLKTDGTRSRIPISTTMKTPPISPGQKESIINTEDEKEILEIMSSPIHSMPMTNTSKYQKSSNNKNVTITSIRTNSRIPSGLPVSGIRPPVPPKRNDSDNDSFSSTNSSISSFKQWVFNPVNSAPNISSSDYHNNK